MARTDKTRPYWVKINEYRNHFPRTTDDWPRTYREYEWWRGVFRCGCSMCGWDGNYATPIRKRRRAEEKKLIKDGYADYLEGDD